ncbi:helix-turn-helix domain-containing protein [Streptomyces chartreusis]
MGRGEKPVVSQAPALVALAEWLRAQRRRTGMTYRQLSTRTPYAATTLQRAASGAATPRLRVVEAYARACEASIEDARELWKTARRAERRAARRGPSVLVPQPEFIQDISELSAALVGAWERAGAPSLRMMEERAGGYGALPRTTLQRIISKQAVPRSMGQFEAMLLACDIPEADRAPWMRAYHRAWANHEEAHDYTLPFSWNSSTAMLESQVRTQLQRGHRANDATPTQQLRARGFVPLEPFPGAVDVPWRSRCSGCGTISAPRLSYARYMDRCRTCRLTPG